MKVVKFIFNPFSENTYVIFDETKEAIIVDPGCYSEKEKNSLIDYIKKNELKPIAIVNTHCHIDHILGVDFLKKYYNLEFWANRKDQYLIDSAEEIAKIYDFEISNKIIIDRNISAKDDIIFGNSKLKVLEVPGHSIGHLAFFSKEDQFVITGDVLFKDTIGRTDLPGGNLDQLMKSIITQILPLGDEVMIFAGHGQDSSIGSERKDNPFL